MKDDCDRAQLVFLWGATDFEAPTDLVSEDGEHIPEGTDLEILRGAEEKCGQRLAIIEHGAIVFADFGGAIPSVTTNWHW